MTTQKQTDEEKAVIETIRKCLKILQRREQEKKAKKQTKREIIRRVIR
jgi:ABC-type transporter MlaC component